MKDEKKTKAQLIKEIKELRKLNNTQDKSEFNCKRSREFLDNIINSIDDLIYIIDETHQNILVNDKYCEVSGLTRDEAMRKSDHDFLPKEEADRFRKIEEKVFKTGETYFFDDVTNYRGKTIIFSTRKSLLIDTLTEDKYIVGISRDITERKQAEENLKKSQSYLFKAQQIANTGSWSWESDSDEVIWSDQTFRMLGYAPNEIQVSYKWLLGIMHPDDVEPLTKGIEESMKTGKPYRLKELKTIMNKVMSEKAI